MRLLGAIHLNVDEHRALFSEADFAGVQVFEESKQGWICVVGIKPA
jgi:hypothetical protein